MTINTAIFAAGCFWGVEHFFKTMSGVTAVISGYSGGHTENPTYEDVLTGDTGHIEVVEIEYDEDKISYNELLDMFFKIHDPTTIDRQGPDIGEQYKSVIFYANEEERQLAKNKIKKIDDATFFKEPIVTEVRAATIFYKAEEYHQDFIEKTGRICYHQMYVNQNQTLFNSDF
jgi:methionine-S-sulfoxide reductase|tara:strand:+ start:1715 stop:2233 length:519 start_codon:yes stop_codon:yes gene_type:complete